MADSTMTAEDAARINGTAPVAVTTTPPRALSKAVVAAYEGIIATVPDAGGDGMEGILRTILQAGNAADLDAPWRSDGLGAYLNVELEFQAIRKMPSDFTSGIGWFLIADAAIVDTGELVTMTTGAGSVVAQLLRAWSLGSFPLRAIPRQSARPTAEGYYPQHLEMVRGA